MGRLTCGAEKWYILTTFISVTTKLENADSFQQDVQVLECSKTSGPWSGNTVLELAALSLKFDGTNNKISDSFIH